ncbi:N-acetylglucosamine-6-phosphate deacetylase [Rhizorhapis suberifaciens]|uniref:N-acetylglucosamine-6-phosphate deacetylase n=1 Tax=Rhizorhapis suberifaciens TaxID=13656 RepID=A0A840HT21_9SPHN|nr:N-acetylglucosamine-6-phosphate deacetylase [Rhizorhapis suberifaciens]MBB4640656.1 N-acetylglucosamine-6-phosphate deacetylase [Rhizorhapis suberifaciens]
MNPIALLPSRVLTPAGYEADRSVLVHQGRIAAVIPSSECPPNIGQRTLEGDLLPGYIDLQVNGGGGVLFNYHPTVDGIAAIGRAHRRFGTTGFLPTLISDDLTVIECAIAAVDAAIGQGLPGVLGIHIEGPFLNPARKGVHDAAKFRTLDAESIDMFSSLKRGRTLLTLAPERVPRGAIRTLVDRGVIVAAGHTAASYEDIQAAFAEGLCGFTHLFNAMTQLGSREPGVVGAALEDGKSWCGLIVDGHHVHPATLRIALAAVGAERLALVTDAMPTMGWSRKEFRLGGVRVVAKDGYCTAPDGTLAGSNLNMAEAVRNAERLMRVDRATAVRMASATPASILGLSHEIGSITAGLRADLVLADASGRVVETWINGEQG